MKQQTNISPNRPREEEELRLPRILATDITFNNKLNVKRVIGRITVYGFFNSASLLFIGFCKTLMKRMMMIMMILVMIMTIK
jgi:hypothetical protein